MKNVLLFLITSLLITSSFASRIHLTDTSNIWKVVYEEYDGFTYRYFYTLAFTGDTVINGMNYKIMTNLTSSPKGYPARYFREDTTNGKAWCIMQSFNDSTEHLIYDDNWQIGDSITWNGFHFQGSSKVTGKDSTFINGEWYKVFQFRSTQSAAVVFEVIEGIGSISGPAFTGQPYTFENSWKLTCFNNNGITPLVNPKIGRYNFDNSLSCTVSVSEHTKNNVRLLVFPNPATEMLTVKDRPELRDIPITFYNASGSIISKHNGGHGDININTAVLAPGLYFLSVPAISAL